MSLIEQAGEGVRAALGEPHRKLLACLSAAATALVEISAQYEAAVEGSSHEKVNELRGAVAGIATAIEEATAGAKDLPAKATELLNAWGLGAPSDGAAEPEPTPPMPTTLPVLGSDGHSVDDRRWMQDIPARTVRGDDGGAPYPRLSLND
jgi:hypothetical protein